MEWFRELPALLRNKKWFLVKRRKSIHAYSSGMGQQKKPTTANRTRLENAIREAYEHLPSVYADSQQPPEALAHFPPDAEQEILEPSTLSTFPATCASTFPPSSIGFHKDAPAMTVTRARTCFGVSPSTSWYMSCVVASLRTTLGTSAAALSLSQWTLKASDLEISHSSSFIG